MIVITLYTVETPIHCTVYTAKYSTDCYLLHCSDRKASTQRGFLYEGPVGSTGGVFEVLRFLCSKSPVGRLHLQYNTVVQHSSIQYIYQVTTPLTIHYNRYITLQYATSA